MDIYDQNIKRLNRNSIDPKIRSIVHYSSNPKPHAEMIKEIIEENKGEVKEILFQPDLFNNDIVYLINVEDGSYINLKTGK